MIAATISETAVPASHHTGLRLTKTTVSLRFGFALPLTERVSAGRNPWRSVRSVSTAYHSSRPAACFNGPRRGNLHPARHHREGESDAAIRAGACVRGRRGALV